MSTASTRSFPKCPTPHEKRCFLGVVFTGWAAFSPAIWPVGAKSETGGGEYRVVACPLSSKTKRRACGQDNRVGENPGYRNLTFWSAHFGLESPSVSFFLRVSAILWLCSKTLGTLRERFLELVPVWLWVEVCVLLSRVFKKQKEGSEVSWRYFTKYGIIIKQ